MKRNNIYPYLLVFAFTALSWSCAKDELSPTSVIIESVNEMNQFDRWLEKSYREQYNIKFKYKYEDIESDMAYDIVPCEEIYSKILSKMVSYLWLDAYVEAADLNFMRSNAPRVMMCVGSGSYNANKTMLLGTAEGGLKITLYVGNWMSRMMDVTFKNGKDDTAGFVVSNIHMESVNYYYLHTIHHEFGHILDQKKSRPTEFNLISAGNYTAQWTNINAENAAALGFVSPYASSEAGEDWVEVLSTYISKSDQEWNELLTLAGPNGAEIIGQKLGFVKSYMRDTWNIHLDQLRRILTRRYAEIEKLDWDNFDTK